MVGLESYRKLENTCTKAYATTAMLSDDTIPIMWIVTKDGKISTTFWHANALSQHTRSDN
jgi:hypothetical protein